MKRIKEERELPGRVFEKSGTFLFFYRCHFCDRSQLCRLAFCLGLTSTDFQGNCSEVCLSLVTRRATWGSQIFQCLNSKAASKKKTRKFWVFQFGIGWNITVLCTLPHLKRFLLKQNCCHSKSSFNENTLLSTGAERMKSIS